MEICKCTKVVAKLDTVCAVAKGSVSDRQYAVPVRLGNAITDYIVKLNS